MKVKCIKNSIDSMTIQMPWIKVGEIYEVVSEHWSRDDYFAVKGEGGCIAFYRKDWFEKI
jgi:hypothetical protein